MAGMYRNTRYAISGIIQYRICDRDIPFALGPRKYRIIQAWHLIVGSAMQALIICTSHLAAQFPAETAKSQPVHWPVWSKNQSTFVLRSKCQEQMPGEDDRAIQSYWCIKYRHVKINCCCLGLWVQLCPTVGHSLKHRSITKISKQVPQNHCQRTLIRHQWHSTSWSQRAIRQRRD